MKRNKSESIWHLKILILLTLILLLPLQHPVNAQGLPISGPTIEIPSSWNPVGAGARALGAGGAFIAVADDATAASWNPGGLIQLEKPEISIVGSYSYRKEDQIFGNTPEASGSKSTSSSDLNFLSLAYPFSLFNRNMIVSLTYQNLFDFNREARSSFSQDDGVLFLDRNLDFRNDGKLSAVGLSYAVSLTPEFSLGLTFNFWEDWFGNHGWKEIRQESTTGILVDPDPFFPPVGLIFEDLTKKEYSFSGFNANLGFLWRVTENLTLGGVLKTPFTADLDIDTTRTTLFEFEGAPDTPETKITHDNFDLEMPLSYGIGLSYRFSDTFTASADIYRTEWDDFLQDGPSGKTSPITGLSEAESNIDPTTQVRVGCEYLFINSQYVIPLRGGLFYDPAPAIGSPDDIYGVSIGSGIVWRGIIFDMAYQYRWGNEIGSSINRGFDFSYDLDEHNVYSSLIIHF